MEIKSRKSKITVKRLALGLAVFFLVVASGVFAYFWQHQAAQTEVQRKAAQSAQSDLKSLKIQLSKLESAQKDETKDATEPSAPAKSNDSDLIVATVGAYSHAHKATENAKLNIEVVKTELPFARARVMTDDGGYACVLKKADNIWLIVFCGQGTPLQDELDVWGVPDSMLTS